jgi:hypothetical protein
MNEDFKMDDFWHWSELYGLREDYEKSGNPLFAWEAIKYGIDHEYQISQWVLSYFKEVAERFLELPKSTVNLDKRVDFVITEILGMKKKDFRNVFDRYRIYKRDDDIISRVCEHLVEQRNGGIYKTGTVSDACEKVAKEVNLDPKTVLKIFYDSAGERGLTERTVRRKKRKNT